MKIHVQDYVKYEDFDVSPLLHLDIILGAPWSQNKYAKLKNLLETLHFLIGIKLLSCKLMVRETLFFCNFFFKIFNGGWNDGLGGVNLAPRRFGVGFGGLDTGRTG